MEILDLKSVRKVFRTGSEDLTVLADVSLSVAEGTILVVSGESGSGKSTLLNLIGGLDEVSSGSIEYRGWEITGRSEAELTEMRSRQLGFIFQFHYLLKDFTALENVLMPAYILGLPIKAARPRAEELLRQVGLWPRREHYPAQLSGGERQRVAVGRALMNDPGLILADEPTGNLDEKNSRLVQDLLFDLVGKYRKTMVLVTHDVELASAGDHRHVLEHGVLRSL
jgi:lipoprotein-releasing system ATP-binding protein